MRKKKKMAVVDHLLLCIRARDLKFEDFLRQLLLLFIYRWAPMQLHRDRRIVKTFWWKIAETSVGWFGSILSKVDWSIIIYLAFGTPQRTTCWSSSLRSEFVDILGGIKISRWQNDEKPFKLLDEWWYSFESRSSSKGVDREWWWEKIVPHLNARGRVWPLVLAYYSCRSSFSTSVLLDSIPTI